MPRCRPGDLCLVIAGESAGHQVTCIEFLGDDPFVVSGVLKLYLRGRAVWRLDRELQWYASGESGGTPISAPFAADEILLPLRGEPDDEFLVTQAESDRQARLSSSNPQVSKI